MEDTVMTTERRRLLDKHLDTWIRSLQLDDVMLFLLAKSVFNEHIVDIIKVTTTHYLERLNPERNSRIPCKILRFFALITLWRILERVHHDYATIPIHTAAKDARKYSFLTILSVTVKNESKVCQTLSYALTRCWNINRLNCKFWKKFEVIKLKKVCFLFHFITINTIVMKRNDTVLQYWILDIWPIWWKVN